MPYITFKKAGRAVFARCLLSAFLCVPWLTPTSAADFRHGQELYNDHCDSCHESFTHPGKDRKVQSLSDLKKRITSWAEHTGQYWSEQDINDVVYYLNKSYFHFDEKAN